ncbi:MAG: B12-binding domain-containing protein [Vicinamibacterales bacterium]
MDGLRQRKREREDRTRQDPANATDSAKRRAHRRQNPSPPAHPRFETLASAIESRVLPRIVLAHRPAPATPPPAGARLAVAAFAQIVLDEDLEVAMRHIATLRQNGIPLESIYLDLLAPTARHFGDLWSEDLCDFTAVTVGLWRLHQIVRELSPSFDARCNPAQPNRSALLLPVPGEQHSFGLAVVSEFFRRAGWDVWADTPGTEHELAGLLRNQWFSVVGFSVGCDTHVEGLATLIHGVRRASLNRGVGVIVGGAAFTRNPELAALVGADATAQDGSQAVDQAEGLLGLLARRC